MAIVNSKRRIVGFIGTGGTGKTTTLTALHEATGWPIVKSKTREVMYRWGFRSEKDQENLSGPDRIRLQEELLITKGAVDSEALLQHKFVPIISDRTPFDNFAYDLYRNSMLLTEDMISDRFAEVNKQLERYSHLFYFPLVTFEHTSDADLFRDTNYGYRRTHDLLLQGLLVDSGLPYTTMPIATVEERVQFIRRTIDVQATSD